MRDPYKWRPFDQRQSRIEGHPSLLSKESGTVRRSCSDWASALDTSLLELDAPVLSI